jgi:prepilin peptidase CpaA
MIDLSLAEILLILVVTPLTAVAAFTDLRTCRIPNKLTLPALLLGLVFQLVFHPHAPTLLGSLIDAAKAFGIGFGTFFVLWLVGGGGGGDAKLMGALSLWLGSRMTIAVLITSTVIVVVGTLAVVGWQALFHGGMRKARERARGAGRAFHATTAAVKGPPQRRIMTFAFPVALATWAVVFWFTIKPHIARAGGPDAGGLPASNTRAS